MCVCFPSAVARQQTHCVWTVYEGHGGRPEDLQRQSQPQDGQTIRRHQHHQHHHKVIVRLHPVVYSDVFYQLLKSETVLRLCVSAKLLMTPKKKLPGDKSGQLVYFTATHYE